MKSSSRKIVPKLAAGAAGFLILILAGCGTIDIASDWRTGDLAIDGKAGDWGGHLRVVEKTPYAVGVLNDGENLYVCLRGDGAPGAGGLFRRGMIVWLDPKGGKDKYVGIRFPIGVEMDDLQAPEERFNDPSMEGRRPRGLPANPDNPDEVEILGPGRDEKTRMKVEELRGIQVALSRAPAGFVYELKIPLKSAENAPFAIGTEPGRVIGVGFEPGEMTRGMMGNRGGMGGMGGRGGMGGMGGRGGMPGGPGGTMGGRGMGELTEPFNAWLKVTLAVPPVASKN
jgi:hypothetical protein